MPQDTQRLVVEIPSSTYERLETLAREQGKFKKQIITEAIEGRWKNRTTHMKAARQREALARETNTNE